MVSFDLTGKKAIVTGSTRGLGRGMAEGLMEAGAEVVIIGTSQKALEVAEEYEKRGFRCHGIVSDLGDRESLTNGFQEAFEKLGGTLDIFVNAAGIQKRHFCEDFPMSDWDAVIDVNLNAVFMLCQLVGREPR